MSRRLFDRDPISDLVRWWHYDANKDEATIETEQEVNPLLDANKVEYNKAPSGWKGDMHRVASIPMHVYMELKAQGVIDDPKRLKAWLNDRDNRFYRTRPGRL